MILLSSTDYRRFTNIQVYKHSRWWAASRSMFWYSVTSRTWAFTKFLYSQCTSYSCLFNLQFYYKTNQRSKCLWYICQTAVEPNFDGASFGCLIRLHTENSSGSGLIANLDRGEMQSVLHFGILSSLIGPFAKDWLKQ